jgi:hypothetical protein
MRAGCDQIIAGSGQGASKKISCHILTHCVVDLFLPIDSTKRGALLLRVLYRQDPDRDHTHITRVVDLAHAPLGRSLVLVGPGGPALLSPI